MAQFKQQTPPRAARPRPVAESHRPRSGSATAASPAVLHADEDLNETYGHVRRDLRRIFFLTVVIFAGILGSQYIR